MSLPPIIQGGMGLGISDWRLAAAVASRGQIGVVSGTCIDLIVARRLQQGDPDGDMRRALAAFPDQAMSARILDRFFIEGGKDPKAPFRNKTMVGEAADQQTLELLVVATFVEVYLAKAGHDGLVGINFLNKIQSPLLPSIYGAMLAGIDIVIVGAGIPFEIPGILAALKDHQPASWKLQVQGAQKGSDHQLRFDPRQVMGDCLPELQKPRFFPIVSSSALAGLLVKKSAGGIDGLIVEHHSAGGHNAPPRGKSELNEAGEPIYGERDAIDIPTIAALGLPFWMAGSYGSPEQLNGALAAGAAGIQVGTLFAFSNESGLQKNYKQQVIDACLRGEAPHVHTSAVASPTGFPFKIPQVPGTLSDESVYAARKRICDLGYLREAYDKGDGTVGWRCAAEPLDAYERKGGKREACAGRQCLCNCLMTNIGLGQQLADGGSEQPLLTCGDDLAVIQAVLADGGSEYSAEQAISYLLGV